MLVVYAEIDAREWPQLDGEIKTTRCEKNCDYAPSPSLGDERERRSVAPGYSGRWRRYLRDGSGARTNALLARALRHVGPARWHGDGLRASMAILRCARCPSRESER